MKNNLRLGFCGSGIFAASCLSLISARIKPDWVITNLAKPSGRGMQLRRTPVHQVSESLGIECFATEKMSEDTIRIDWIKDHLPDLILVIDFGHMIKEPMLNMAPLGCINIHPSMLPRYRGSAPVQRAILDGLSETGVTLFRLDAGMDSGPILAQSSVQIKESDDSSSLLEKCSVIGTEMLLRYIFDIETAQWIFSPQSTDGVSLAPKIDKAEGKISWEQNSFDIFNRIRALNVSPGTYCSLSGKRLRIHSAVPVVKNGVSGTIIDLEDGMPVIACSIGALKLIKVQPEGKKIQNADEWLRGSRMKIGDILC